VLTEEKHVDNFDALKAVKANKSLMTNEDDKTLIWPRKVGI